MSLVPKFTMNPLVPITTRCVSGGTLVPGIAGSSTEPHSMAVEYYQQWPLNCRRFSSKRELETQKELGNGGTGWKQTLLQILGTTVRWWSKDVPEGKVPRAMQHWVGG